MSILEKLAKTLFIKQSANIKFPLSLADNEWFSAISDSYTNPPVSTCGVTLPGFPPDEIQKRTTGQSGVPTLKEAFVFYQDCYRTFKELALPFKDNSLLLDFGCGWGRISRFFLRDIPIRNLYGIDVMPEFTKICSETFESQNFATVDPFPPTHFHDNTFNFIVGYSVFSHLSESACTKWMNEFARILIPGGILALTTRSRDFLKFCENQQGQERSGYLEALSRLFPDFDQARKKYDNGEFLHSNVQGVNGGGKMTSEFYGETFIPEKYANKAYKDIFTLEKYLFNPPRQNHPIMFFSKK